MLRAGPMLSRLLTNSLRRPIFACGVARRTTTRRGDGTLAWLRERNRERGVGVLRTLGRTSQADIARSTGLSRPPVPTLVADLQVSGLGFAAAGKAPGQRGGGPGGARRRPGP